MKRNLIFTLLLICFTCISGYAAVLINEVNSTGKWIELYNSGESRVDVSGYMITRYNNDGKSKTAAIPTGTIIAAKGYLVLYQGAADGGSAPSPVEGAIDCLNFGISSTKFMNVILRDFYWTVVDNTFDIGNPQGIKAVRDQSWARETDGSAKIVAKSPTPKKSNTSPVENSDRKIYINEINSTGKWIELYNDENNEVNVGGYIITRNNNDDAVGLTAIPAGTVIASKGFLVLYRSTTAPSPVDDAIGSLTFGISSAKFEGAFLRDTQGRMVDNTFYVGDPQEPSVSKGQSWARKTDGEDHIVSVAPTPGESNTSEPKFSNQKIYVNEVNAIGNWIEFYNDEDNEVNVSGYIIVRINNDEAAGLVAIPAGTVIAPKGYLVLYQGIESGGTSLSPVAGAIDCLTFGISLAKFESITISDTKGYIVDNTFDIGDPQEITAGENQSWAREPDSSPVIKAQNPTPGAPNGLPSSIATFKAENTLVSVYGGMLYVPENTSSIQLYGISGNLVLNKKVTGTSVDLSNLPKGFYLVKLTISGVLHTQKIVLHL